MGGLEVLHVQPFTHISPDLFSGNHKGFDQKTKVCTLYMRFTVQLRYIRTTHTRIIRSYFAYTRMSIRVYAYDYIRIRVCEYARICPFVMHSHKFLYMKHCWSNKGHRGMKRLQSEICILLKRHADQ